MSGTIYGKLTMYNEHNALKGKDIFLGEGTWRVMS